LTTPLLEYGRTTEGRGGTLGRRTAMGFVFLVGQTLSTKVLSMAAQVVLAWFLAREDFGLVGLAMTVAAFASLVQQAGLREILIYRQHRYARWANVAFWMSLAIGVVSGVIMAAAAPVAAHFYGEPRIVGLILVLAIAAPLSALDTVADARLQSQMRFGLLASVNFFTALLTFYLSVQFAWLGWGAMSFVLPKPIVAVVRLVILWAAARPPVSLKPRVRRWKYLIRDSATLLAANAVDLLTWQGDYVLLGLLHPTEVVGLYFFAFNLSLQTMQLFTANLTGVLFPALSSLQQEPRRQTLAFLSAARLLAIVAVPLCLLQIPLASPAVRLLFPQKWLAAIPVLQILSVGMAMRVVASPAGSLLQAQGRFRLILLTNILNATLFLALVAAGALLGKGLIYYAFIAPLFIYIAIKSGGGTLLDVCKLYAAPLLSGGVALLGAFGIASAISDSSPHPIVEMAAVSVVGGLLYVCLIRLLAPRAWHELVRRLAALLPRPRSLRSAGTPVVSRTAG
jgi:O-antigen/teichoic acid export membrane protein